VTKELNGLKNKTTKAAKEMKESERRCMVDDSISECDCERLQAIILLLEERIRSVMGLLNDDYCIGIDEEIKTDPNSFF
jgi:hypothetical protein